MKLFLMTCLSVVLSIANWNVDAATYHFFQGGFPNGGYVKGSFSGEDKYSESNPYTGDGRISTCSGRYCGYYYSEVSEFSIYFGGNSLFRSINSFPERGLRGLSYNIKANTLYLGYGSCDTICFPYWAYSSSFRGLIRIPDENEPYGFLDLQTSQAIVVTPIPGALGLFVTGLLWLGVGVRHKINI